MPTKIPSGIPVAAVFATEVSFEESTCVPHVPRCVYHMYSLSYMYRFSFLPYIDSLVSESIGKSEHGLIIFRIQHSMSNQLSPNLRVSETGKRFNRTIAIFVIHSYRRYPIASFMNSPMRNLPFIHGECPRKPEKTMFTRSSQLVDITFSCLGVFSDSTLFFQGVCGALLLMYQLIK